MRMDILLMIRSQCRLGHGGADMCSITAKMTFTLAWRTVDGLLGIHTLSMVH